MTSLRLENISLMHKTQVYLYVLAMKIEKKKIIKNDFIKSTIKKTKILKNKFNTIL